MLMKSRFPFFCLLAAVFLAGCGKETPETAPATSTSPPTRKTATTSAAPETAGNAAPTSATVTLADLDAVTKADAPYKIVLIVKTRNNPFFQPMIAAFEKTAKELGAEPEVQAPPQEMDKEKQFALVQTMVSKGFKAICIAPADSKGIVPALKAAQEAGVVVVNLDNQVDKATAQAQGLNLAGYVGANNEQGGKLAGEAMLTALDNTGSVAILEGIRGVDNAESRKRGFAAAVQGKLKIAASETAEWDTEKAYAKTQNILAAHPEITGIFCANDKMAVGAMKAVAEANKTGKITVIGYDNIPDVQASLASGAMTATIEQHPDLMGRYGAKMAVGILNGKISKGGNIMVNLETIHKK